MPQTNEHYLEQKTLDALRLAKQDWAKASRLLCKWVEEDHKLLLALTEKYLRGATRQSVESIAKKHAGTEKPSLQSPAKSALKKNKDPITRIAPKTPIVGNDPALTASIWDNIIMQMQEIPTVDAEQHEKVLRTIAKAFVAKRFDALDEQKGRFGCH